MVIAAPGILVYLIVPTTHQLLVRVNFERQGQPEPFDIKLVYDPAAPKS